GLFGGSIRTAKIPGISSTFLADGAGSLVVFAPNGNNVPTVIDEILDTANGGLIEAEQVTFLGVWNKGAVQIPPNGTVIVNNILRNDGSILVNTTASNMTTTLRFDSASELLGSGK